MLRQNNKHTPARAAVLAAVLRTLAALSGVFFYKNGFKLKLKLKLNLKLGAVIAQRACKHPDTSPPAPCPHHHPAHRPVHLPAGLCLVTVSVHLMSPMTCLAPTDKCPSKCGFPFGMAEKPLTFVPPN
jgi:hypothetical protein